MPMVKSRFPITFLAVGAILTSALAQAEVIFKESFDEQPDWTSAMHSSDGVQRASTHIIPEGWYSIRQDPTWAPSEGYPDKHETIEILSSNSDKARGGQGKSMVSWRDSYDAGWKRWNSESMMLKYLPKGYEELYVEFWIRFSEDWTRELVAGTPSATSKLLRISSWSGDGSEYGAFNDGNIGPIALWDYTVNGYGARNRLSFRGGPHSDNYSFKNADISGLPRSLVGVGDLSLNFTHDLKAMGLDGTQPHIEDRVNGGLITPKSSGIISHNQVYGPGASWTKMAFYVKMNTSPGAKDGVFRQWMNDKQIFINTSIPWIRPSESRNENAKWNLVAIGGNDFFQTYPNSERYEEWYAIDDLVIRTDIPEYVEKNESMSPNPPIDLQVN